MGLYFWIDGAQVNQCVSTKRTIMGRENAKGMALVGHTVRPLRNCGEVGSSGGNRRLMQQLSAHWH